MTKIEFMDGTILTARGVHSGGIFYQGTAREAYTFIFDPETDLSTLSNMFVPEKCDTIILHPDDEEGSSYIHEHFTIRYGLGCSTMENALGEIASSQNVSAVGTESDPQKIFVAWVKMIRTTLAEQKLIEQQEVLDHLIVAELMRSGGEN